MVKMTRRSNNERLYNTNPVRFNRKSFSEAAVFMFYIRSEPNKNGKNKSKRN